MITKLLVANRGEIAARVFRTAHALGIATVAVYSDADADLPFVALADEAVRLPGVTPAETYLRADAVLAAARATGADAVHPGYGFLSERAGFARACAEAGLIFVGPSPEAIAAMGDKVAAKELMRRAGVPVLPGAVLDPDRAPAPEGVGFPLLVKAAFGGGGRGMRVVRAAAELAGAVDSARREAAAAFGDGTVFLERYLPDPRHIEVQILGDGRGGVVALFERECSIQRRYQKIVEEAPSPAVDDALRAALEDAAVAAGKAIGYAGAGTVEFVLAASGEFYFLEVNTRLQVEHPVTELVTGLDLVELQLRVAGGEPLPPGVLGARLDGHAIEARLYAEDVPAGYLPATGTLHTFEVPVVDGVRVDAGVATGSVVGPHYDPMLAKVIAHGRTRADAARRLARALAGARIHGVTTNRDLLVGILREPDFLAGRTDTGYLGRHPEVVSGERSQGTTRHSRGQHAVAAALAGQAANRAAAPVLGSLPSGWRSVVGPARRVRYADGDRTLEVAYRIGRDGLRVSVDGEPVGGEVRLLAARPDGVVLEVDGVRRAYAVHRVEGGGGAGSGGWVYVDGPDGASSLREVPWFTDPADSVAAGSLLAPMPGAVLRVLAEPGAEVVAGQPLIVLEAMKMEHTVAAPGAGTLTEVPVRPGSQVTTGQVLAVLTTPGS
ncbi:MAG TPA: biotin carboxylase N-terminal domain-containing protein [Pseudonocardia sp.]|jgi:acetyl/propionyl-CoA carboxylase alpha subunit|nr:biotin carboxylase N-terminal domain-containing protein [Pseudonocardia sp.]